MAAAIVASRVTLGIDSKLNAQQVPSVLETTVDGARSILSALAGGLISSVALLLSLMLVAVQLASSQFSPRTLRGWVGDRTQQRAIGVVLGTVVYCLLVLRETRTSAEGNSLTPHSSVIVAVLLGIFSLVAVVRAVDHLTDRLRVGSVASRLMEDTIALIEANERLLAIGEPAMIPVAQTAQDNLMLLPPEGSLPIPAQASGWVQQIDVQALIRTAPKGSTVYLTTTVGSYSFPQAPLAWIAPAPDDEEECIFGIRATIALGDARTMQQDIGFGILQMVDIALRALSPGVNDPHTANDLIVHLGVVMLSLWETPVLQRVHEAEGRTLVRSDPTHGDYLQSAFASIRLYGASDPQVAGTLVRTLVSLHTEARRRSLPGPLEPIEQLIYQVLSDVDRTDLSDYDKDFVRSLMSVDLDSTTA